MTYHRLTSPMTLKRQSSTQSISNFQKAGFKGCYFHFCENIYRHVQSSGLQERYTTNAKVTLEVRQLAAVAFVLVGDVVNFFELLELSLSDAAEPLIEYSEIKNMQLIGSEFSNWVFTVSFKCVRSCFYPVVKSKYVFAERTREKTNVV